MTASNKVIPMSGRFRPVRFGELEDKTAVWVLVGPEAWATAERIQQARETGSPEIVAAMAADPLAELDGGIVPLVVTPRDLATHDWRHRLILASADTTDVNIQRAGKIDSGLVLELAAHVREQAADNARLLIDGAAPDMAVLGLYQHGKPTGMLPDGFRLDDLGVWFDDVKPNGECEPVRLCAPLSVLANTHDPHEGSYGRLLEWSTIRGTTRRWAMPMALLCGNGEELRRQLLDGGLGYVSPNRKARERLLEYLSACRPERSLICLDRTGWHNGCYVLPDTAIGPDSENMIFQSGRSTGDGFTTAGSLDEWKAQIGALCQGNSRLLFAVSVAFAAPLLRIMGMDGGGFHLKGESTDGKSTVMKVAASVCGGADYWHTWRATGNAIEAIASRRNDALLCLDELKEVEPKAAGSVAYMLANGQGKGRARIDGDLRERKQWRLLFFSTGELSLAEHAEQAGGRFYGGMDVRLPQIPSDTGKHGCFETLHGLPSAKAFADALRVRTGELYGTPLRAFAKAVAADFDMCQIRLREDVARITQELIPQGAGNQVGRVAERFALVAVAGELATGQGITGWSTGDVMDAVRVCFTAWLSARGHLGNYEDAAALEQVRRFVTANQFSRFAEWNDSQHRPANMVGYRRTDDSGATSFYVMPSAWPEITRGFDGQKVASLCKESGYLLTDPGRFQKLMRLPGTNGRTRTYALTELVLGSGDE